MLSTTTNDNLNLGLGKVDRALDCLEQYCRRNCKLIHGINEENQENTDAVVITILKKSNVQENDTSRYRHTEFR